MKKNKSIGVVITILFFSFIPAFAMKYWTSQSCPHAFLEDSQHSPSPRLNKSYNPMHETASVHDGDYLYILDMLKKNKYWHSSFTVLELDSKRYEFYDAVDYLLAYTQLIIINHKKAKDSIDNNEKLFFMDQRKLLDQAVCICLSPENEKIAMLVTDDKACCKFFNITLDEIQGDEGTAYLLSSFKHMLEELASSRSNNMQKEKCRWALTKLLILKGWPAQKIRYELAKSQEHDLDLSFEEVLFDFEV